MNREPTRDDIDALVGPATPHFAYQIRARVEELVSGLPEDHPVRAYAEEQMDRLDRLRHASSQAGEGPRGAAGRGRRAGGRGGGRGGAAGGRSPRPPPRPPPPPPPAGNRLRRGRVGGDRPRDR